MGPITALLLAATVPHAIAGPDLAETAKETAAPIAEVTVFSDRARVTREARVELGSGVQALRLPDLPGATLLDTVRIDGRGARVLRLETTPVQRQRLGLDQVDDLIRRLEAANDEIARADGEIRARQEALSLLAGLSPQPPVSESERVGRPALPLSAAGWRTVLDFAGQRRESLRAQIRELAVQRKDLVEKRTAIAREVAAADLGGFTERRIQVVVLLDAARAGSGRLRLQYDVPGARWTPAYALHFDPASKKLTLRTRGRVRQATGEDWDGVELSLSTAIPGRGIEMPELLTWTLGEKREFVPHPRPERPIARARLNPPPRPHPTPAEAERTARLEVLRPRLQRLQTLLAQAEAGETGRGTATLDALRGSRGMAAPPSPAPPPRPSRAARSRPPVSRAEEAPSAAPEGALDFGDESLSMAKSQPRKKIASSGLTVALAEPQSGWTAPSFSDPNLPAVSAGGLDYVWVSPLAARVPSTGEDFEVPLDEATWPVDTFYEATPSLAKTAYLSAEVKNGGRRPLLRGPMSLFVGGDFVADGALETTGPGGTIRLPLGADEDLRFEYTVVPQTVTEGVIGKKDVTTYTTTIEIGNYKRRDVRLVVYDQIPKTNNEDIEVELVDATPAAAEGPDGKGRLKWDVSLAAGRTTRIVFRYTIRRPADFRLHQN